MVCFVCVFVPPCASTSVGFVFSAIFLIVTSINYFFALHFLLSVCLSAVYYYCFVSVFCVLVSFVNSYMFFSINFCNNDALCYFIGYTNDFTHSIFMKKMYIFFYCLFIFVVYCIFLIYSCFVRVSVLGSVIVAAWLLCIFQLSHMSLVARVLVLFILPLEKFFAVIFLDMSLCFFVHL